MELSVCPVPAGTANRDVVRCGCGVTGYRIENADHGYAFQENRPIVCPDVLAERTLELGVNIEFVANIPQ